MAEHQERWESDVTDAIGAAGIVDIYDGAYGRTIRIATSREGAMARLRSVFLRLAHGDERKVELVRGVLSDFSALTPFDFWLLRVEDGAGALAVDSKTSVIRVSWSLAAEQCNHVVALIDGLLQEGRGHQYLCEGDGGSPLVELSYRERN